MATGEARDAVAEAPDHKVLFGHPNKLIDERTGQINSYYSAVFQNNPKIAQPGEPLGKVICIKNFPTMRPYIDYRNCLVKGEKFVKIVFVDEFRAPRGELFFTDEEIGVGEVLLGTVIKRDVPIFIIEPNAKIEFTRNKLWIPDRWEALANQLSSVGTVIRMGPKDSIGPTNLPHIITRDFRAALSVMRVLKADERSVVLITTDGGLHHAAAALGLPAVVLWTGFTSPKHLGYDDHINIAPFDIDRPFGVVKPFKKCRDIAASISTSEVADHAIKLAESI